MNFKHTKTEIGKVIRDRRRSRKILQEDVADVAGISSRTLRDIENGIANPELDTLLRICDTLGLDLTIQITK